MPIKLRIETNLTRILSKIKFFKHFRHCNYNWQRMSEHHHQLSMLHASPTYTSALSGEGNFSTGNPPSNNEKSANTYAMHSATEITITAISTIASILFIFCLLRYLFRRFRVKIFPLLGNLFAKLSRRRRRNVVQETVSQTNQQTAPSGRLIKLE